MEKDAASILVVDDDREIVRSLELFLGRYFTSVITELDPYKIEGILKGKEINVVLLDMNFRRGIRSGEEGFMWLKRIRKASPGTEVVMITAYGDVEMAIRAIKEGAHDFIMKPWINEKMLATVMAAVRQSVSNQTLDHMQLVQKQLLNERSPKELMDESLSDNVRRMFEVVRKVAASDASVLITGENGSGKENIAETIHYLSKRKEGPFVRVDLGAINTNLFESELFGHVKGAFTDAREERIGRVEISSGGTLFLDEIANLPLNMQSKLLSVIQSRKVIRVGSSKETMVDFRLVCATNRDLSMMTREGSFREDLLYRVNTVEIDVPPLRERSEDIRLFLDHFLDLYANRYNKRIKDYDRKLADSLISYHWPGNIRELKHAVERAVILSDGEHLTIDDFPFIRKEKAVSRIQGNRLEEIEMEHIIELLKKNGGHISRTASELGISRYTLHRKIKKYEI